VTKGNRRPDEARHRSEGRFRALVENSADVLMLLDGDGRITYATPSAEHHFGWAAGDLIGQPAIDFLHPEDLALFTTRVADGLGGDGGPVSADLRIRHQDGSYRTTEVVAANRLDEPALASIVVNARDVTDRRRIDEQLRQGQKIDAAGRLAGGIAHDFNNLLTAILGYCNLLLENLAVNTEMRSDLEEIRKAGERAAALTRQLLSFSRRQVLRPQPIELSVFIAQLHERLRDLLGRRIDLVMTLTPELPMVVVDPGAIEEILVNLALHAREALPDGGRLTVETISVARDATAHGLSPAMMAAGDVMIAVSDNGQGMNEATRSRLFEPFFSTDSRRQGTGLGLATVYGLVQQIGGSIQVSSEPGHGTVFRISLTSLDATARGPSNPDAAAT
jgi:two-component system cell cycle sensor histidine kinase/response regulator CckA